MVIGWFTQISWRILNWLKEVLLKHIHFIHELVSFLIASFHKLLKLKEIQKKRRRSLYGYKSPHLRESNTVLDSRFQVLDYSLCQRNFWVSLLMGPGFLELYSGFQSPGFRILQAWISRISDSTSKNFRYSGFPYIRRYKDRFSQPRSQGSLLPVPEKIWERGCVFHFHWDCILY